MKAVDKRLSEVFTKLRSEINEDKSRMVDLGKRKSLLSSRVETYFLRFTLTFVTRIFWRTKFLDFSQLVMFGLLFQEDFDPI